MAAKFRIEISGSLPAFSDKCILPPSLLAEAVASHDQLPHPMVFSLNNKVLVGVREFTAPENTVLVPQQIAARLGSDVASCELQNTVPRATSLRIRPAQFYPHVTNWKYYLESFLSTQYTTLSETQRFCYTDAVAGMDVELVVEAANAPLVLVVDTDITLDVAPLNDIMAAQQLHHESEMLKFDDIPEITAGATLEVEPLNKTAHPRIYKLDLLRFPHTAALQMTSPDDPYNSDLLCSLDKLLSLDNFMWSTMAQDCGTTLLKSVVIDTASDVISNSRLKSPGLDNLWLYVVPFCWEHKSTVAISVSDHLAVDTASVEDSANKAECANCHVQVEHSKLQLHEAFCYRNNVRCSCGQVFPKQVPATHWHCDKCADVHGDSALFKFKHDRLYHNQPYRCDKCTDKTEHETFLALVQNHKAASCASKLHECQFCHLVLPQGESTFEDRFLNLTHHENECGNKTAECYQCGKVLRNKELASHMKIHELVKTERNAESYPKCVNANCANASLLPQNPLGLCETCYGPLYSSTHDPSNTKLQLRIERKYVLQLTRGCGHLWCQNRECANGNEKLGLKEALAHVKADLLPKIASPSLPINSGKRSSASNELWFCVSENMQRKKKFVDLLVCEGQYHENMIYRAVAVQGIDGAQSWLMQNAA